MGDIEQQNREFAQQTPAAQPLPLNWDALVSDSLNQFLHAFQQIPIRVPSTQAEAKIIYVHAPYMQGSVAWLKDGQKRLGDDVLARLQNVAAARMQAPEATRQLLQQHLYTAEGQERLVAQGRATSLAIQQLLQTAVYAHVVPTKAGNRCPDAQDCRAWLQTYGIGVDCSAFVQQALTHLVKASNHATGKEQSAIDADAVGWIRSVTVYQEVQQGNGRFTAIHTPQDARPGDVLVCSGHIRMVVRGETAVTGHILHLVESTSKEGVPLGCQLITTDVGPQSIQVTYPLPQKAIAHQTPWVKRPHDPEFHPDAQESTYILGRLKTLAQFVDDNGLRL
ncbi:MAG: hypothetical protein R3E31_26050 [Chloroflexota bacterium]